MSKKRRSKYHKARSLAVFKVAVLTAFIFVLYFPQRNVKASEEDNYFAIKVNGEVIGYTDDVSTIYECYTEARKELAASSSDMLLIEYPNITYESKNVTFGVIDSKDTITQAFLKTLTELESTEYKSAYSVKVGQTIIYLESASDIEAVLTAAIRKYDPDEHFSVAIENDKKRELSCLTAYIKDNKVAIADEKGYFEVAGLDKSMDFNEGELTNNKALSFESFDLGIKDVRFKEYIEIAKAHVSSDKIMSVDEALGALTLNQETQQIYKVESGDTLSEISIKVGLPLDDIIAMNDELENENSTIYIDQELIITVPKPELSIEWTELIRVDEAYELPIEYTYNDSWYTNQSVTHVQPSAGYHEAVVSVTNVNDDVQDKETVYEEIKMQAVAKQVEIGTIIPPTYIKPLAGGRLTSGFGPRKAPKKGASTYHKGIDWATPVGTSVYASSGGTVAFAGWGSGYGNVVYINHPDGKQTRYGHLSRIYVKAGDTVRQGQVIAASGNTGVSTGPHVHFEILVNGTHVNPFSYMN